jgi:hypothetical protein
VLNNTQAPGRLKMIGDLYTILESDSLNARSRRLANKLIGCLQAQSAENQTSNSLAQKAAMDFISQFEVSDDKSRIYQLTLLS